MWFMVLKTTLKNLDTVGYKSFGKLESLFALVVTNRLETTEWRVQNLVNYVFLEDFVLNLL